MIIPFFLTRQTANLMEDFARELKQEPALFLLYGETGVGKTRLLQELCQSRFEEQRIHWLDLGSGDSADGTRLDYSHGIEDLFDKIDEGDIVIADHFEEALKKTRHQLFLSWSTDGIDKKVTMIIGSNNEGFNELRQLSQQYQVRVQSFQQMPFSADEVDAFIGFALFPDEPAARIRIPGPVRKQLAATQGNVAQIIDIIEHHGKQIKSSPAQESESIRQGSKIIVAVMLLFIVAIGVGWFYTQSPVVDDEPSVATQPAEPLPVPVQAEVAEEVAETATEADVPAQEEIAPVATAAISEETLPQDVPAGTDSNLVSQDVAPQQSVAAETDADESAVEIAATDDAAETAATVDNASGAIDSADESGAPAYTAELSTVGVAGTVTQSSDAQNTGSAAADSNTADASDALDEAEPLLESEPGTVSDSEAVIDESIIADQDAAMEAADDPAPEASQPLSNWDKFARDLKDSMTWIRQHENRVGTIQILLLTFDTFDADVYYQYVANLARKQVDTDRLHVFKTLTGNKEVYSVFYGEYPSRPVALEAIDELPRVLRDASPIPRSVGGIWQEIRRLEAKN